MKRSWLFFAAVLFGSAHAEEPKPNIVLINADDLGYAELGCYGQEKIQTPNLDKLAAGGQRWTNYYCGAPVCSPSRNVLLTGRHGGGCDVQDLKRVDKSEGSKDAELKGDWPISEGAYTLHMALKKAGYDTATFGKWGLGEFGTSGAPDKHGTDVFYGYTDQRACHSFYPAFLWDNGRKDLLNDPEIPGHARQAEGPVDDAKYTGTRHASKEILAHMLKYVEGRKATGRPFFLYYAPTEPHVALQPPKEWVDKYPKEWDAKPYLGNNSYLPHSRPRAAYAAMISFLDHNVGQLMDALKTQGLDKNTIVVFTSDNGTTHDVGGVDHRFFNSVSNLRGLKGQTYEGGIRVPGIVYWPGKVPAGKVVDQPGYDADIMPTLCALAGADAGQSYGDVLLPVWLGQKDKLESRKPMVWCSGGYGGQVAVRLGDMKAVRRDLFPAAKDGPSDWEVYDLAKDRGETTDLASSRRDVIEQAQAVLKKEYRVAAGFNELQIFAPEKKAGESTGPKRGEAIFKGLDQDGDGKLTFDEWKSSPRGKALKPEHREKAFDGLDKNHDKAVSEEEFLAQFKQ
ncbi:sulfatase-like hydrolase/transferase [Luteolibacter sp. LG18]|uniref:sulfatase-like hydrolase/transferase n=1 Tax=Luteolibacter sp. LG18 TaxID=2819286 RepID=UPI002B2F37E4|nr:arylsulfatase [Luteolibacter sp. LG18]